MKFSSPSYNESEACAKKKFVLSHSLFFLIYQAIEVGTIDALEFKYYNSKVFYKHNFPDILGIHGPEKFNLGAYAAFDSGVRCCLPSLLSYVLKAIMLYTRKTVSVERLLKLHIGLSTILLIGDLLTLYTFDPLTHSMDRNHLHMYNLHALVEGLSLLTCAIC